MAARFLQVLAADTPELRIVPDKIGKFTALLDKVALREALNLFREASHAQ
jgi:hypothetical protein